jgi:hypothetical protein
MQQIAAPVAAEWGVGTFVGLFLATGAMAACGTVMYDLVLTMWTWGDPSPATGFLLETFRGLFQN